MLWGLKRCRGPQPAILHLWLLSLGKGPVCALPPDRAVRCAALQRCWKFQAMLASDHRAKNQGSCFARVFQMYFALSRVGRSLCSLPRSRPSQSLLILLVLPLLSWTLLCISTHNLGDKRHSSAMSSFSYYSCSLMFLLADRPEIPTKFAIYTATFFFLTET